MLINLEMLSKSLKNSFDTAAKNCYSANLKRD